MMIMMMMMIKFVLLENAACAQDKLQVARRETALQGETVMAKSGKL